MINTTYSGRQLEDAEKSAQLLASVPEEKRDVARMIMTAYTNGFDAACELISGASKSAAE